MQEHSRHTGFTLIELSIVLVIVGLVVGGVFIAREMEWNSQRLKAIRIEQQLQTAVTTYSLKYQALPGDDKEAQMRFGATDCPDYGSNLCNGDGDGLIENSNSYEGGNASGGGFETIQVWHHLALAGLIPGSYTGQYLDAADKVWAAAGINNAYYRLHYYPGPWYGTIGRSGHFIIMDASTVGGSGMGGYALTPADALWIDTKVDDGIALSGNVYGWHNVGENCFDWSLRHQYNVSYSTAACWLFFRIGT